MTVADEQLIAAVADEDGELHIHLEKHRILDERIDELNKRRFLTPTEEAERKMLRKKRLFGRDKIQKILLQYRMNERVIF
jgi:hypothetical protein